MYEQINNFDKNNMERIYNLLVLKGEALLKGHLLAMHHNANNFSEYNNFFTAISNQADTLLIYFINDEISASLHERGPLRKLIKDVRSIHYIDEHFKRLEYAESDLHELFANRTDFVIGSNILDFKVNTFSAFEKYIGELYDKLLSNQQRSDKKEKKLIKLIGEYSESHNEEARQSILEKIKKFLSTYLVLKKLSMYSLDQKSQMTKRSSSVTFWIFIEIREILFTIWEFTKAKVNQ